MLDHDHIISVVHGYVEAFDRGDSEALVQLFAEDAAIEDPVDSDPTVGHAAIRKFYQRVVAAGAKLTLTGPIRTTSRYAAFSFETLVKYQGVNCKIDVINILRFNDAGKIEKMEAYFGPENIGAL